MITTKVFRVKSDVETICHCGHSVHNGAEYFIIRTSVPKWVSLCPVCVHMLRQPTMVDMRELKKFWAWENHGKSGETKAKIIKSKVEKQRVRDEKDLKVAVWV